MSFRVSTSAGLVAPNLVMAAGWALAACKEPGDWAAIEDVEGKVSLERLPDLSVKLDTLTLIEPGWLSRLHNLVAQESP